MGVQVPSSAPTLGNDMSDLGIYLFGIIMGVILTAGIVSVFPDYKDGIDKMTKEAVERGYMEKGISDDDKVIYTWK